MISMAENRWATGVASDPKKWPDKWVTRVMVPLKVELFWPQLQTVLFGPTLISGDVPQKYYQLELTTIYMLFKGSGSMSRTQATILSFAVAVVQRHTPDPQRGAKVDGRLDSLASLLYQLELLEGDPHHWMHQLIGSLSHYLQVFFTSQVVLGFLPSTVSLFFLGFL